jgi:uncharacterized protein (TIGR02118 family)
VIKVFFVLRRRPNVTLEQFHDYWRNTHGPLVAKVPGLIRYVQHHTMSVPRPGYASDEPPIDGLVETWWESMEAVQRASLSPEFAAVMADEANFMGHSNRNVHAILATESVTFVDHEQLGG